MQQDLEEIKRICHNMAYGDDSKENFKRYCELIGWQGTEEEREKFRQETFED